VIPDGGAKRARPAESRNRRAFLLYTPLSPPLSRQARGPQSAASSKFSASRKPLLVTSLLVSGVPCPGIWRFVWGLGLAEAPPAHATRCRASQRGPWIGHSFLVASSSSPIACYEGGTRATIYYLLDTEYVLAPSSLLIMRSTSGSKF
jgi:hypothetical protein